MDNNVKTSSFACAMAFSELMGYLVGRGIFAGVKKTPASIIPRLAILALFEASVFSGDEYSKWCYAVGDAFTSKAREAWERLKCWKLGIPFDKGVYEELCSK